MTTTLLDVLLDRADLEGNLGGAGQVIADLARAGAAATARHWLTGAPADGRYNWAALVLATAADERGVVRRTVLDDMAQEDPVYNIEDRLPGLLVAGWLFAHLDGTLRITMPARVT